MRFHGERRVNYILLIKKKKKTLLYKINKFKRREKKVEMNVAFSQGAGSTKVREN